MEFVLVKITGETVEKIIKKKSRLSAFVITSLSYD